MHDVGLVTADEKLRTFIGDVVSDLQNEVGDLLSAVILHGSLAMGTFHAPKSDIDLLVLVEDLSANQASQLYRLLQRYHLIRPYAGGLEVSVMRAADASYPKHPVPFLVHFSETSTGWQPWADGQLPVDEDLIAHLTVAKYRGRSLYGPAPQDIIGNLPWSDYLASVRGDIAWILKGENILRSPYYGILNLCRWAMMSGTVDRVVPGKEEAGVWAMSNLPEEQREIIVQALAAYRNADWPKTIHERQLSGGPWCRRKLINFRDYMLSRFV